MNKLLEPGKIGTMKLKNRIVMAPMFAMGMTSPTQQQGFSQRGVDFYGARAKGGVGLIITGVTAPNEKLEKSWGWPLISDKSAIMWLNELAEEVHAHYGKIAIQYSIGFGRQQPPDPSLPHGGTVAPSPVTNFYDPSVICRELRTEEVEELIRDFGQGARYIKEAGIDAIELHAHQGYLLDQFITARTNWRTDKYGGSFENRMRIVAELLEAVRKETGPDYPVIFRYGLSHFLDGQPEYEGARTLEEGLRVARFAESIGFDALHIDAGVYESNNWAQPSGAQPQGCLVPLAELVKQEVNIPVITVGKLGDPKVAEQVLIDGKADFVALGRPLLADPDWVNKVRASELEDIRPCIQCNEGCLVRLIERKYFSCTVNPQAGNERNLALKPAAVSKRVVVVGGGPGGMEAARVAAIRGHKVTLIEKSRELGGMLIPAGAPSFKSEYITYRDYLSTQLRKLDVDIRTGTEATSSLILSMEPDVVFLATGALPFKPPIAGIDRPEVLMGVDLLKDKPEVGQEIVVIGGGLVGAEVAMFLARQGKRVTIVEALEDIMKDAFFADSLDFKRRFTGIEDEKLDVTILTQAKALEIGDDGVTVLHQDEQKTIKADHVVVAVGMKSVEDKLESELRGKVMDVFEIGDRVRTRKVLEAVWEGYRIASNI